MAPDPTALALVHTIAGVDDVVVETHAYGELPFDLYRPPGPAASRGAVVIVTGLPDPGVAKMLGKPLRAWASYVGWARLIAASGMIAIAYENRTSADVAALFAHLRAHAAELAIDPARLGVWACSGHGANALATIARERPACAALLYPYLIDLDGATAVAEAAAQFRFATPPVTLDELAAAHTPMLLVRAGRDAMPGLEPTLQRFVAAARAHALPVTLIDLADAPHAFDLADDSPATHDAIDRVLAFLRAELA